jgi:hypothetical protein
MGSNLSNVTFRTARTWWRNIVHKTMFIDWTIDISVLLSSQVLIEGGLNMCTRCI